MRASVSTAVSELQFCSDRTRSRDIGLCLFTLNHELGFFPCKVPYRRGVELPVRVTWKGTYWQEQRKEATPWQALRTKST